MALDERAIAQVLEQVRRGLRATTYGRIEIDLNDRQWTVKRMQRVREEGEACG